MPAHSPFPIRPTSASPAGRRISIVLPQTKIGAASALILCAILGSIYVPAVGWASYAMWYACVATVFLSRQLYFGALIKRFGYTDDTLLRIAWTCAFSGGLAISSLPLFAKALSLPDMAVLSAIAVGWATVGVSVLWVKPKVYAAYVCANQLMVFCAWMERGEQGVLLVLASSLIFGAILMANLARLIVRQQNELEHAAQIKTRFLAAANHDLRQPAHALGLFMSRLKTNPDDHQLLEGVDASVRALLEMLDVFFDYTHLESNLTDVRISEFPIQQLLSKLSSSYSETAASKGLRLVVRPCDAVVSSDPMLLHRILLNLLSNALKYTVSGTVLVCCRPLKQGNLLRLDVMDSGIGISPEHHSQIFEEFFQVENAARNREKGIGLGLSLVQEACRLLDHSITVRSGLGCGSKFSVTVPMLSRQSPPFIPPVDSAEYKEKSSTQFKVLLLEDDPLGASAMVGLLESWQFQVFVAADGSEAEKLLAKGTKPDFVICDYRLPGAMTGVDVVQSIRLQFQSSVPACIITGDVDHSVKSRVLSAGLTLLSKPVAPSKLRAVLRRSGLYY